MKTYKIACHVQEDKLHSLIQYLEAIGVSQFSVNLQPADKPAPVTSPVVAASTPRPLAHQPQQKAFYYVGGKRNKGITAEELVMQVLNTSPEPIVSRTDLQTEFVKHGFAKTSISNPLSQLTRDKRIVHVGEGLYALRSRHVVPATNGAARVEQ